MASLKKQDKKINSMKNTLATLLFVFPMLMGAACDQNIPTPANGDQDSNTENTEIMSDTLLIKIGDKEFTATLLGNPTAAAFRAMLPLIINMTELNGNEKYFRLSKNLPTNESNPGTIQSGDLMLYGSNTFVLFYESFSTSYSYTKLGKINNASGLAAALGTGNVSVSISLK
jgi:hypothetical protein